MSIQKQSQPASHEITGRDGYILAKALAYAIATIQSLPVIRQEASDCDDMCDILCHLVPSAEARGRMAREIGEVLQTSPSL